MINLPSYDLIPFSFSKYSDIYNELETDEEISTYIGDIEYLFTKPNNQDTHLITKDNEIIGFIHIHQNIKEKFVYYICGIRKKYRHCNHAYNVLEELTNYIFDVTNEFDSIKVWIEEDNLASRRLAEKLNFNYIGQDQEFNIYERQRTLWKKL